MISTEDSSEGVYFLSLSLENVRCFAEKQTLDLSDGNGRPAQWTVILGNNGTGKTTLLEVLPILMSYNPFYEDSLQRVNEDSLTINICIAFDNLLKNKQSNFQEYKFEIKIDSSGRMDSVIPHEVNKIKGVDIFKMKIYAYGASRRQSQNNSRELVIEKAINLFYDQAPLINAEKWLLETDYIASKESDIQENYQKRFKVITETLINLLPDVKDIRISKPSEKSPNPRAEFKTPDGWLLLSQLSLGYQTMTAWIVDLAAQLFRDYPNSPNPIAEPAVVLIDEIDLHLHPKWQRTIMSYLSERFINIQFIVTAHSPLIVQAAENANIVVLKREANGVVIQKQPEDVHGWRVDQLLTSDLFDLSSARSSHYEKLLQQRRDILSKAELNNEDKEKLKELEAEMGYLPTAETAEDIKAMDIIRRAAQLLKQ